MISDCILFTLDIFFASNEIFPFTLLLIHTPNTSSSEPFYTYNDDEGEEEIVFRINQPIERCFELYSLYFPYKPFYV